MRIQARKLTFKNIKPFPMSYLIYFTEIRTCELSIPKVGKTHKIRYLEKEVKKVNKFFARNNDFVHYMEQDYGYLDHQFFAETTGIIFHLLQRLTIISIRSLPPPMICYGRKFRLYTGSFIIYEKDYRNSNQEMTICIRKKTDCTCMVRF